MPATSSSSTLKDLMRRHPLVSYFVLAYAGSWIPLIPFILAVWGYVPDTWAALFWINTFTGPALAGLVMVGITEGRPGMRHFLRRFAIWRVGWRWYAFILLGIPALMLAGVLVLPGVAASFQWPPPESKALAIFRGNFALLYLVNFVGVALIGGPLGEETGWRGFALPRLQPRYGPLGASLLLGFLWACWHLLDFLTPLQHGGPGTDWATFFTNFPIFTAMTMAMAVIVTWVFNHTRASIFIAILLHAAVDNSGVIVGLFSAPLVTEHDTEALLAFGLTALVLIAVTRGRLGYHDGQEQAWGTLAEPALATS